MGRCLSNLRMWAIISAVPTAPLALSYWEAIRELEANTGKTYEKLYIVGGGAKNAFLNQLTAEATGKEVVALPIEATALGNLKIQMEGVISC